jgi:tetratricopeptide (TPR) repeat protein/DNA-binding XRE family transcriptional regulator
VAVAARRRLPGLKVRPGAVRQARNEAGLSLAGVARTDLSRTAIFLIETGKSNPTLPTLELIAERTGKPVDFFLEDELPNLGPGIDFIEIEQLLASEDFERVKELTAHHLAVRLSRADTARLRFLKGQAHIRQADADGAAPLLMGAREYYESVMDKAMAVECLSWEVHIPFLLEDPNALAFAEAALQRCRQLKPVPLMTEVRILSRIAGIHSFNRSWPEAVRMFEDVVERLGPLRDMNRMAKVYAELGMAYREMGQPQLSARYSQKSIALNEMLRDQYSTAAAENNLALALINMQNYSSAEEHLDRSMEIFEGLGRDRGRSEVLLSYSELHLMRGRLEEAEAMALEAMELSSRLNERPTEANAHEWLGRIAAARGDRKATDAEFGMAISKLEGLNLVERLIRVHATYAQVLEERGDHQAANQHLRDVVSLNRPDLISQSTLEERRRELA